MTSISAGADTGDEPTHLQAVSNVISILGGRVINSHFMGSHALDCGNAGWRVMPVGRRKNPLIDDWPNKATTDPDTIIEWWTRWPDALIGALIPDWILVLDIE